MYRASCADTALGHDAPGIYGNETTRFIQMALLSRLALLPREGRWQCFGDRDERDDRASFESAIV